ncbi:sodium:proton exchanger [Streptomyces sp. PBH53]|uniref:cation:proton antiporter n=1 Tax=Streptomyces sp. PBH53 TaxID=1577075 RepID=UPI000654E2B0|nr:cation:proton antiporter [Streptomyces sp. PBH53]AKN68989.1 sodium:proton exchanger [Streptomyces sp. PBH53]
MSLTPSDTAHVLLALVVLATCAHGVGHVFKRLRQPQVIGEIVGGLLLGPTVLGRISPEAQHWLLPPDGPTAAVLGAFYQIGLLLLVWLTGSELRTSDAGSERRTIGSVAVSGLVLPFACGLAVAQVLDPGELSGPTGSPATLALVFGMAIAITSVPVISRIMLDLDVLGTRFSRIVLAVAVVEDVVLYVILAIVLGVAQAETSDPHGLWSLIGTDSLPLAVVYFTAVPLVFLVVTTRWGPRLFAALSRCAFNVLNLQSPLAFRISFVFLLCAGCIGLGIDPIFGALVAGMSTAGASAAGASAAGTSATGAGASAAGTSATGAGASAASAVPAGEAAAAAGSSHQTLRSVSLGFFVPVYFAIVGVKLDLARHLDLVFFCWFLVFACVVKLVSVWAGAAVAGESRGSAFHLAVAMNARGGPGIVLASTALQAQIINEDFFTALVLLSMVTSQIAGVFLGRAVRAGRLPTKAGQPPPEPAARHRPPRVQQEQL